jgi:hypothetical protein
LTFLKLFYGRHTPKLFIVADPQVIVGEVCAHTISVPKYEKLPV